MLGTLLDCAGPQQRWPSGRQVASVVVEGLRVRLGGGGRLTAGQVWRDGLQVAVLLLLSWELAAMASVAVADALTDVVVWRAAPSAAEAGVALPAVLLVLRGRLAWALVPAAVWLGVQVRFLAVSWYLVVAVGALVLLVAVLRPPAGQARRRAGRVRSVAWLLVVPAALAWHAGLWLLSAADVYLYQPVEPAIFVVVVAGLAGVLFDARWPVVAAVLTLAQMLRMSVTGPVLADSDGSGIVVSLADRAVSATVAVPQRFSGVFVFTDLTWWTLALAVAAGLLVVAGRLTVRAHARL